MRVVFRRRYAFEVWVPFLGWRELVVWYRDDRKPDWLSRIAKFRSQR